MTADTENVVRLIREAFGRTIHPGPEQIVPLSAKSDEAREVARKYAYFLWQDVPSETLGQNADDLCFMTPVAFVYFLPRFLVESLEHYDDPNSAVAEDVVFQLTPQPDSKALDSRLALMSDGEKEATALFLSHVRGMADVEGSYMAARADQALASLWHRFRRS